MVYTAPPLPYATNALAKKGISENTVSTHYGKHEMGYAAKLTSLTEGRDDLKDMSYEDLIMTQKGAIFNNAAQVWNHAFYWNCMSPNGGGAPEAGLASALNKRYGSFDKFKEEFTNRGTFHFGSGWVWLVVAKDGALEVVETHDAGCPLTEHQRPLLCCDVWEHAYYLDYKNDRTKYFNAFWSLVNWKFVEECYKAPNTLSILQMHLLTKVTPPPKQTNMFQKMFSCMFGCVPKPAKPNGNWTYDVKVVDHAPKSVHFENDVNYSK